MSSNRQSWSFLNTSVEKSFFWSLILSFLPVISAFAVSWFIARWAGAAVWGTVSWAMAFATAVLIVGKFGLELGTSRIASEYGANRPGALRRLFRTGFGLRMAFTLPVAALTVILAPTIAGWFNNSTLTGPIYAAAGVVVCASVYEFCEQFLIGLNRHATVSKIRCLMLLSRVALSVGIVLAGYGATRILGGYNVAWVIAILVFAALLYRYLPRSSEDDKNGSVTRRLLALSIPLAVSSASVTVFSQMDKLMLGYFDGVEEVGQYAVARAVTEVSLFPAFAFVTTLRPALASRYAAGEMGQCSALIRNALRLSLVFGVLFAAIFGVLATPLLTWVYSSQYAYAGQIMTVFVFVLILRSLGSLVLPALVAAERTRLYAYLTAFSAVINFGLNLVLIPRYHARGAVLATVISYGFLLVAGLSETFRIFGVRIRRSSLSGAIRTVLAGAGASGLMWFVLRHFYPGGYSNPDARVILWVFVVVGVYTALLFVLRVVRPDEIRRTLGNLRNRK
jgi:O-antigen/teichoic acid export membrane protein